jgi:hypothetical protein
MGNVDMDNTKFTEEQLDKLVDALNEGENLCGKCQRAPHWGKVTAFHGFIDDRVKQGRCIICGKSLKVEA